MRKIKLLFIPLILTMLLLSVSCHLLIPPTGGGEEGDSTLIYDKDTPLNIVNAEELSEDMISTLYSEFLYVMSEFPKIVGENSEKIENEIVIGKSSRQVSLDGYALMEKSEPETNDHVRFLIYTDGKSIALCYDRDSENAAAKTVIDYFVKNLIKASLSVENTGTIYKGQLSVSEYIDSEDEKFVEERWALLEAKVGKDIARSLKSLYSVFGDEMFSWFANLYDPGVGGYYFSNSGRDGMDFLPDIESTAQALGFMSAAGMFMQTGETIKDFIPEDMQKQIIRFAKSLQDPSDGYFYHPQWGKAIASSRQTRDLGWATSVLQNFGSAPTYDAPNGVKGDGILADGTAAVMPLSVCYSSAKSSAAMAVSKVVAAAEFSGRVESVESFLEYLESRFGENGNQPIEKYSYVAGNELGSLGHIIVERDKVLEAEGKPTIAPVLIEWLNERQNEYGHWHYETDEAGNLKKDELGNYIPLTNYYANNGLLKIINAYNTLGYKMPRTLEATETAIASITSKEEVKAVVDVYNTWFCVNCIRRNLVNFGGEEGKAEYAELKVRLYELAPEAILVTRDKLAIFRKIDDSFSQAPKSSSSTSQNAPVAVPGTNEGDVNATRCALQTITDLYGALDMDDVFVPLYTHRDAVRYKEKLSGLRPFEKPTIEYVEPDVLDDEYKGTGIYKDKSLGYGDTTAKELSESGIIGTNFPNFLLFDDLNADISVNVGKVENDSTLVFKNYHYQRDPMLMFNVTDRTVWDKNDSYVFETDFLYEFGTRDDGGDVVQFLLLTDKANASSSWFDGSLAIVYDAASDTYSLSGCGCSGYAIELGYWYNLRIEIKDTRSGSAKIELYLNGELIGEKNATTSARQIDAFTVRHRYDVKNGRIFFDNTYVNSVNETGETYVDPNTYVEIPEYTRGEGEEKNNAEGFADKTAAQLKDDGILGIVNTGLVESGFYGIYFDNYEDSKATQYAKVDTLDGDAALEFGSKGNGDPYLTFLNSGSGVTGATDDTYVLEFDFKFDSLNVANGSGNLFVIYLSASADKYQETGVGITVNKNAYDEYYVSLGSRTNVAKLEAEKWYNVRLEISNTTTNTVLTLKVNGKVIETAELNKTVTVGSVMTRFSWGERSGKVFFDNLYFENIEEQ